MYVLAASRSDASHSHGWYYTQVQWWCDLVTLAIVGVFRFVLYRQGSLPTSISFAVYKQWFQTCNVQY
jgi:hypothetical protein